MKKILFCCMAILSMSAAFAAPTYKVVDLGTLNKEMSVATSINDKGEVCGAFKSSPKATPELFLWSQGTGLICPHAKVDSNHIGSGDSVLIINQKGQVVGQHLINPNNKNGVCMWDPEQGMKNLNSKLVRRGVQIQDFNDVGELVYSEHGNVHVYNTSDGRSIDLGKLFDTNYRVHINNKSELFGTIKASNGYMVARFHSLRDKSTYDINNKLKSHFFGQGINDHSIGAVRWQTSEGEGGAIWSAASGVQASSSVVPKGINNKNQLLGLSNTVYIYDNGAWKDLNELLKLTHDPSNPFERIEVIHDINNAGQMVGSAIIKGKSHAVLITPVDVESKK